MSFTHSQLLNIQTSVDLKSLYADIIYPKLILFEDLSTFRIVDLSNHDKEEKDVEEVIVDKKIVNGLLWIILKSGQIILMDLLRNTKMKLTTNLRIHSIKLYKDRLFFISESGEYYDLPNTIAEFQEKLCEGTEELVVTLRTVKLHNITINTEIEGLSSCGLYTFIENGMLKIQCPLTGLVEIIESELCLEYLFAWEDNLVLSTKCEMYIINLPESKVLYTFVNIQSNYYPLVVHDGCLYYLLWNKSEIQVCCIWQTSNNGEQNNKHLNISQAISSQENLIGRLKSLVDGVISESKNVNINSEMQELYGKITDFDFLIEASIKLCKHSVIYKPLLYPLQRRVHNSNTPELQAKLTDLIIKVDLLEYILFKGSKSYESVKLFELSFKDLCIMFISKSDIDLASICWLKYLEIKIELSPEDILDILNAIPHNTKMGAIIIWLQNFVPPLLEHNPFYIDLFVKWTTNRVFRIEQSAYWPKIGIKFLDKIINVLEKSSRTITIRPISMDDLDMLLNHIKYILELKESYKINMLLVEITSRGPQEIATIMLRRCYTEDLEAFLQNYLPTYATQHMFDIDDTLRGFIENEIATCGGQVDGVRLKILLDAFHSLTSRLDCMLQVLKVLDVPWHPTILELAISAAVYVTKDLTVSDKDYELAEEIQKELVFCKIKVVMKKYNFPLTFIDYKLILHKLVSAPQVDLNDLKVITNILASRASYGHILYINRCIHDCEIRIALNYFKELSKNEKAIIIKAVLLKFEQIINKSRSSYTIERNYLDFIKGTHCLSKLQFHDVELSYHKKYNKTIERQNQNSQWQELLLLLNETSTSHQVRRFVSNLLDSNRINAEKDESNQSSTICDFKDGQNLLLLKETWKVLIEMLEKCKEEHLHEIITLLYKLNTLIHSSFIIKNLSIAWKFHYIHLSVSSTAALNELIDFCNTYKIDKEADILNISKCDIIIFRLISFAITNMPYNTSTELLSPLMERSTKRLLTQIVSSQSIDELLVTALLLTLKTKEERDSDRWVLEVLQGHNENLSASVICFLSSAPMRRTLNMNSDIFGNTISYSPRYILKTKFNINLSEITIPENKEETWDVKVILFYILKQRPSTSFGELLEFCCALNIPYGEGLSLQLISVITNWNLNYKTFVDELGNHQIIIDDENNDFFNTCHAIWESIDKKDNIKNILNNFWKNGEITLHNRPLSINPYFYEVFLCIYRLLFGSGLESKHTQEYYLLNFLKEYRRKSTPKQYEYEMFPGAMFPEIGHFRLPFLLFTRDDKWANLKSEITLETYERWLPAVSLLCLDTDPQTARDMICSNALKQTMTTRKRIEDDRAVSSQWHLTSREEPLLRAAHRCVRHIANMEWTGACLFYLLQGCAQGADQVAAAQLCYQFAQRWAALQPGNRAVRQMERLYATLSTRHALCKIDWTCNELVQLTNEPAQLIRELYLHPDFTNKIARHNVNRAANEIADKNGINVSSIRLQILENILNKSKQDTKNKQIASLDTTELLTAKYILKATCPKMGAIYLSRIAFDDETDYNKGKKLRALQCLMSIVEPDTALKVTNRERDALWPSLLELLCVVKLENIDMPWVVVTFLQDKICALKQSLQTVEGNSDGIRTVAELAYWYGTPDIICDVILHLLRGGLYEEIIPLIMKVSSPPNSIISTAWRAILLSPFQRADYPITEHQRYKCLSAINLLPICPVIKDEDLIEIWKNCVRCKCLGLGCLILPYMSLDCRQSLNELTKVDRRNLIASLKNLQSETYLVSGAMNVIENMTPKHYR